MGIKLLKFHRNWRFCVWVLVGLMAAPACLPKGPVPGDETGAADVPSEEVLATLVTSKDVPMIYKARAEIIPANYIKIQATAPGRVEQVLVHEGQKIAAGTTVLRYDVELNQLKLELAQAESEEADAAIDYEQYRLDNRDTLLDEEEISSTVYDSLERKLEYERARSKRAKAELAYLQSLVKEKDVVSTIAGTVTSRTVADGMPVVEGQALMEILQDDPVKLLLRLPEEYIPATHRGQELLVRFPDAERGEAAIKLEEIGVAVDPLTRTFDVMASLDNADGRLKAGMELETTLVTDKKTTILAIPKSAVALRDNKAVVFRIIDGIAKQTPLRLGQPAGADVAVLHGLEEGDIIVVDPPDSLRDGDEVEILTAAARPAREFEEAEVTAEEAVEPALAVPAPTTDRRAAPSAASREEIRERLRQRTMRLRGGLRPETEELEEAPEEIEEEFEEEPYQAYEDVEEDVEEDVYEPEEIEAEFADEVEEDYPSE